MFFKFKSSWKYMFGSIGRKNTNISIKDLNLNSILDNEEFIKNKENYFKFCFRFISLFYSISLF